MGAGLDASTLRRTMSLYLEALEEHREEIDSLNVFPVPDGDTGTNLVLTQRAVVETVGEAGDGSLGDVGEAISRAALMGARGNSGVILSQILRGFCERYCVELDRDADERLDGRDVAAALVRADEEAGKAVAEPREGTILSVLHDAAVAGREAAERDADPAAVLEAAFEAGAASLERTPELLEELREAGVVDAGGKGLVLLLDAMRAAISGEDLRTPVGPLGPVGHVEQAGGEGTRYGYEVMYVIHVAGPALQPLRQSLDRIGDSLAVVGGGGLYQVHVHTDDPGRAVEEGIRTGGRLEQIRITSLDEQVAEHCVGGNGFRAVQPGEATGDTVEGGRPPARETSHALVAVAQGRGMVSLFESLGAEVVEGGPGSNPPVRELVEAIERTGGRVVFLLPNHRNVVPAAEAAAREADREVEVVRTESMAQGLAAAAAYVPGDAGPAGIATSMRASAEEMCWGEVAVAEKAASWSGGEIRAGDWLGLRGDDVLAVGDDAAKVAVELCAALGVSADGDSTICDELATLYLGADATDEDGERLAGALGDAFPHLEVEVQRGDQPRYPYLIGIE